MFKIPQTIRITSEKDNDVYIPISRCIQSYGRSVYTARIYGISIYTAPLRMALTKSESEVSSTSRILVCWDSPVPTKTMSRSSTLLGRREPSTKVETGNCEWEVGG